MSATSTELPSFLKEKAALRRSAAVLIDDLDARSPY
jgi:hypothetical protein